MFQENQNCSTETEATNVNNESQINENEASADLPVTPDETAHENGTGCERELKILS